MATMSSPKDEIVTLEYATVKVVIRFDLSTDLSNQTSCFKVPYELLNKKFRSVQKVLDREITQVTNGTAELSHRLPETSVSSVGGLLSNVEHRLVTLKRKAEQSFVEELECTRLCKARMDHLKAYVSGKALHIKISRGIGSDS